MNAISILRTHTSPAALLLSAIIVLTSKPLIAQDDSIGTADTKRTVARTNRLTQDIRRQSESSRGDSSRDASRGIRQPPGGGAPIDITIDESGRLIIQSDDPEALNRLEQVMSVNRPPQRRYDVFKVKHARATWIQLNLEDYFEDAGDDDDWRFRFFYGFNEPKQDDKRELGKRPPLRFIADNDTNSIVVIGADDKDRDTIRELIELWDVPEPESEIDDSRWIKLVKIQYSTAETIANTMKEAFRDLLSANDKAFGSEDEESKRDGGGSDGGFSFAYKGKLSLGVDPITNSILVNAEGRVLSELIVGTIKELDEQAKTENEVGVYRMPATVNGKDVAETLKRLLGKPQQPDKNQQQQNQQQQQQQQQQQLEQQQRNQSQGRSSRRGSRRG